MSADDEHAPGGGDLVRASGPLHRRRAHRESRARTPWRSAASGGELTPWRPRRALAIVGVVAALAGAGVADRVVARAAPRPVPPMAALDATTVPAPASESSAWYCAGGTGAQGGAPMSLVLTNATVHAVTGRVTVIPALAADASASPWAGAATIAAVVPAQGQLVLGPSQLGSSSFLAAAVVLDGGGVSATQAVSSPLGWSMAPCAATSAPNWYFAHGATTQGGGLVLALFNPGATDAAVNVSLFSATAGFIAPAAYQGIDVPPGSLVTENIGDHAVDDKALATAVAALTGSVVATELESVGTPGSGGLSVTLGTPATARQWAFAQNASVGGGHVVFHVFDPSTQPASVSVTIGLTGGAAAEPLTLNVPAQSQAELDTGSQIRIPASTPYSLTFTAHGAGIVVARQVSAPSGIAAPVPEDGVQAGIPGANRRWLVPTVVSPGTSAWALAVVDEGPAPTVVHITMAGGKAIAGVHERKVEPGVPLIIGPTPGAPYGTEPLEIGASQPVAVELDALPVAAPGVVVVPAFALS